MIPFTGLKYDIEYYLFDDKFYYLDEGNISYLSVDLESGGSGGEKGMIDFKGKIVELIIPHEGSAYYKNKKGKFMKTKIFQMF